MKKITEKDARYAVQLFAAIAELPKVRKSLTDKRSKFQDSVHLEMSGAEMLDGEGQGATHYFTVPPALGRSILDAAEKIIRAEMERLNVTAPKGRR